MAPATQMHTAKFPAALSNPLVRGARPGQTGFTGQRLPAMPARIARPQTPRASPIFNATVRHNAPWENKPAAR